MIIYLLRCVMEVMATVIAYLTNPIVVLFADEYGNLPKCLRFWQTFDNCLDVGWMLSEHCVPKFAEYDFDKHYIYHLEDKSDPEHIIPGYVEIIDADFSLKEKLQRYICRLCWLYRNCNYGFSYEINGLEYDGKDNVVLIRINETDNEQWLSYVKTTDNPFRQCLNLLWNGHFSWFYCKKYCKWFKLRIYLGWKLKGSTKDKKYHTMLALFIWPFRKAE